MLRLCAQRLFSCGVNTLALVTAHLSLLGAVYARQLLQGQSPKKIPDS
jgi:hypothetical protein